MNPSAYGTPITFTATVAQTDVVPLGGTVTFMDGSTVLGTVELDGTSDGYQAVFTAGNLSLGDHNIQAIYNGDGFHVGSSASLTQTVEQAPTATSVTSSNDPALPGQPVTFTASVFAAYGTPTGTVTFEDGTTVLGTAMLDANGNATFTISSLTAGSHNITAVYGGDDNFTGSSGTLTQVISQETTSSISLSSSDLFPIPDEAMTFTATVSGNSGTPTGTVTFLDGTTILGTATLDSNGIATLSTSTLALGSHTITAIYGGDATYGSNAAFLTQSVEQDDSIDTGLFSSINPSQPGQAVTFTFLTAKYLHDTPTGNVTLYDGTTVLGTVPLGSNGDASFTTATLSTGSHAITAVYSGDATYPGSNPALVQIVGQSSGLESNLILTSSPDLSAPGQEVTLIATASGSSGTPTGTVTFLDGTTELGTATLDANGNATFMTSALLGLGDQVITAIYSGDGTYAGSSTSDFPTQSVVQAGSTTSFSSSANPSPQGEAVTFTVTVATVDPDAGTPTGTVSFYDGTTFLGTVTLSVVNGQVQATFTTAAMALGKHEILAIYSGDSTFADSGASLEQTISS